MYNDVYRPICNNDNNSSKMTCNDCMHQTACFDWCRGFGQEAELCEHFSDKAEWIHLPCKAGDVVYQVTRNFISEFRVRFVEIATCGNLFLHTDLISGIVYTGEVFSESDIGKTVFLTREEAEKALEDMRKEDERK